MNTANLARTLREISRKQVLVGIPQENNPRPGDPIGNAAIAYINEHGSPANNIPPRPHFRPGITDAQRQISQRLEAAAKVAMAGGQETTVTMYMGQAGQAAVNSIKRRIQRGLLPPLAPATVAARTTGRGRRTREAARRGMSLMALAREEALDGSVKPLIDTGDYINSIVWVIDQTG
jgi:hypothetical protein